jgi:soluble lytic murein transglycosylase
MKMKRYTKTQTPTPLRRSAKRWWWLIPLLAVSLPAPAAKVTGKSAHAHAPARQSQKAAAPTPENRFLAAREAFQKGDRQKLAQALEALRGQDMEPMVEYWTLRLRVEDVTVDRSAADQVLPLVTDFLTRQKNSYLAERLRGDWLRALGRRHQWELFQQDWSGILQPDPDLVCYSLQSRLTLQKDATALDEARPLWTGAAELPEACGPVIDSLVAAGRLSEEDIWQRVRRQLEQKRPNQARAALQLLPAAQRPEGHLIDSVGDKPAQYFAHLPANFATTRASREMALFAVQRMASQDPVAVAAQWQGIESKFPAAERGYAWGQIAWWGAQRHQSEALTWFERAKDAPLSEEQRAWKVRAALRAMNWPLVQKAITDMPPAQAADPTWTYWLGRALAAQGKRDDAAALFRRIGGQPNFYGNLADEELGRPIVVPPKAAPVTSEELAQALATPGLRRALALFQLDLRTEAVREWNWTLRDMDDRRLLAAAELARRHDIFDRAINTADRTRVQHDYGMRYLAPFRDQVDPKARAMALDTGWVYGLMRQESRFIMGAKSVVGAKGLMQLMPATAKWVAKKIGMEGYHPGRVAEMDINVTLGTAYMKMVLESLDNHPVLASAAYNAGPGRAKRWRADRPIEGAIYAETIPFNETRDYVKKVMSNAVYYSTMFEDKPQSLKSRLGTIQPGRAGDTRGADLP